jgi:hypothetical protein
MKFAFTKRNPFQRPDWVALDDVCYSIIIAINPADISPENLQSRDLCPKENLLKHPRVLSNMHCRRCSVNFITSAGA